MSEDPIGTPRAAPPHPAPVAAWLLARLLPRDLRDAIIGDLLERHAGPARWWREVSNAPRTWTIPSVTASAHPEQTESRMSQFIADLRFAWRVMARRKGTTAVAVGTLTLGIGAATAIFSVVDPVLLRTVPYPEADRVVMVWERAPTRERLNLGFATVEDLARGARSFEAIAAMGSLNGTMTTAGEPRPLSGQRVSPDFFRVLGVAPAMGRLFEPSDDVRGTPNVLVISHGTWQDAFGGDPDVLGRPVTLDDRQYTVIGVLPESFENVISPLAGIYAPLRYESTLEWACRTCRHLRAVGRLRPGISPEAATAELAVIARNLRADHPTEYPESGMFIESLARYVTRDVRPAFLALAGGVLILVLIASLNVSNLLLARGASRRGEFAIRVALGADRVRIARQLLAESVLLALMGGAGAVLLTYLGVQSLVALAPASLPRVGAIEVNGSVLTFALVITSVIGVVVSLVPMRQAVGARLSAGIRMGARQVIGTDRRTRRVLVVGQVALALVLLVGSGLLLRSMQRVLAVDPGFDPRQVQTAMVQAGAGELSSDTLVTRFFADALAAVRQLPGVEGAAFTSQLPLSGDFDGYGISVEDSSGVRPNGDRSAFRYAVSAGYLEAMRIPLLSGRTLSPQDDERSVPVAVISRSLAERHFPGVDPIGRRIKVGGAPIAPWREVVGVVGDVRQVSLENDPAPAVYLPESQWQFVDATRSLVVRGDAPPETLVPAIRSAIWAVDKDQPIMRVVTGEGLVAATAAGRRFALVLFQGFAIVALLLAAAGIYGVLLGSVTERSRELGVRAAFGASARDLVWMVIRQGMTLTLVGVAAGLLLAAALSRAIASLLFGITAMDPFTYAAVTVCLLLVALLACFVPAFRASRVDPMETLRAE